MFIIYSIGINLKNQILNVFYSVGMISICYLKFNDTKFSIRRIVQKNSQIVKLTEIPIKICDCSELLRIAVYNYACKILKLRITIAIALNLYVVNNTGYCITM